MKGVWLARSRLILDLLEHLPHVGEAKFPGVVLPEYMKLATGDLIPFGPQVVKSLKSWSG
jgi:hypothetical protein